MQSAPKNAINRRRTAGGGGALLREKITAQASRRINIVAGDNKLSPRLGTRPSLPIEVLLFGWLSQFRYIESLGAKVKARLDPDGSPFMIDSGNMILDCSFGPIADPVERAAKLGLRGGVVEDGLFLGLATEAIVAGKDGVRHITRKDKGG